MCEIMARLYYIGGDSESLTLTDPMLCLKVIHMRLQIAIVVGLEVGSLTRKGF